MVLYRIIGWFYIESCYVSCLTIKPKRSSGLVKQGGIPLLLVYCALCQPIFRISHRLVARLQRWAVKSCLVVPACLCSVVCVWGGACRVTTCVRCRAVFCLFEAKYDGACGEVRCPSGPFILQIPFVVWCLFAYSTAENPCGISHCLFPVNRMRGASCHYKNMWCKALERH